MASFENMFNDIHMLEVLADLNKRFKKKVDAVEGKTLSSNDYTNDDKAKIALIDNKVDKVEGKDLVSTTDITQITTNKEAIASLTTELGLKAKQSDLESLISRVTTLETDLEGIAEFLESRI